MLNNNQKHLLAALGLIIIGVASRIVPHEPNLSAVSAATIVAALYLPKHFAYIIPFLIMILSDAIIGAHPTIAWVYGSYALIAAMSVFLAKRFSVAIPLLSSALFFIITNFGVWASTQMYAKTLAGLIECYTMAIPFLRGTVAGDIAYTALLLTGIAIVRVFWRMNSPANRHNIDGQS